MRSEQEVNRAIERHADTVRRLCMIHLKNYHDTEDIFQSVFLKYVLSSVVFENEEVAAAHSAGMSYGKYKAFLELRELNPDIAIEDVRDLTMRQIRDMINTLSNGTEDIIQKDNTDKGSGGHGYGHGNGNRNGY